MLTPRGHAALSLGVLPEDEAEHDVETADGKEEKARDERKVINMVRKNGRTDSTCRNFVNGRTVKMTAERDVQALHDTECAQAKFRPKHGEIPVEEIRRPPNLREEEHDDLEDEE